MTSKEKRELFAMTDISEDLREKARERDDGDNYNYGYYSGYYEALIRMIYYSGLERYYEDYLRKKGKVK